MLFADQRFNAARGNLRETSGLNLTTDEATEISALQTELASLKGNVSEAASERVTEINLRACELMDNAIPRSLPIPVQRQ